MKREVFDAVVVGAGAGGGCAAKTLACAGIKTLLLERGEWLKSDVYGEDDLAGQRTCWLVQGPGRGGARTRRCHYADNGRHQVVAPVNAACVGSGTVTYGAMAWRFMETDFALKSHYGEVPGSSLEDWPITYRDLEPYYEKAEYEVGVSGSMEGNPFAAPRRRPYPMPPFEYDAESRLMADTMKSMGLHPFHVPFLRNSVPYNGRPACIHQRSCVGFQCPIDAKNGTQNTVIPVALASGNCELRIRSMVTELMVDDRGRLSGVRYMDGNDGLHEVVAKVVVLACSATGTARTLLTSVSKLFPNGAGNNHDMVGRNLQDHAYVEARGFLDRDILFESGPGCGVGFSDCNHDNPGFVNGGVLCTDFQFTPAIFAASDFGHGMPRWGIGHKDFVRRNYRRMVRLCGPMQGVPRLENRMVLDRSRLDWWGLPLVRYEGQEHENDVKGRIFLANRCREVLEKAGAKDIQMGAVEKTPRRVWMGQHQAGSCRMGSDPEKSVTDAWGRVWDFPNLFIADGSLNVNNGGFNPVLTIMALAFRVADGIVRNWDRS